MQPHPNLGTKVRLPPGGPVLVASLGRKPLNTPLENCLRAVQTHRSVVSAA